MNVPRRRRSSTASIISSFATSLKKSSGFSALNTGVRREGLDGKITTNSRDDILNENYEPRSDVQENTPLIGAASPSPSVSLSGSHNVSSDFTYQTLETPLPGSPSSTAQTIFNITNLLIGIGLLSLPLGFKQAGWALGSLLLIAGSIVTAYTAILLGRSLETDKGAYAYSDLAALAFSPFGTAWVALIFILELLAATSALTVLFGDNTSAVFPILSSDSWKLVCFLICLPCTLLPLRILSYTSIIGILSTVVLIVVIFTDGVSHVHAPGSLREPMPTHIWPMWKEVPLALGLLMAPWGGHGVFPNVYADQRTRSSFSKSVIISYTFSFLICAFVAVIGYLMFGSSIKGEITLNLLEVKGYSVVGNKIAVTMTALTSLTKIPLGAKCIAANIDIFFGLKTLQDEWHSATKRLVGYLSVRLVVVGSVYAISVLFPNFESIMSILGSSFCFLISVILPVLFYIRIVGKARIGRSTTTALLGLVVLCAALGMLGTIFAIIYAQGRL